MYRQRSIHKILSLLALITLQASNTFADPAKFSLAKAIMQQHCFGCHSTWTNYTEQAWINSGIVIPQNVKDSPLTLRIKYGKTDNVLSAEDMPKPKGSVVWNNFSTADYNTIKDWIATLQGTTGGGPITPGTGEIHRASDEAIRIGDRYFVKNALESIYGTEVSPITDKYIFRKISFFGGACDPKEHYTYLQGTTTRSHYMNCEGVDFFDTRSSLTPPSSALREGSLIKACTEINVKDDRINFVVSKLGSNTTSWPNNTHVSSAYKLFYPGRALVGKVELSLIGVVDGAKQQFPTKPIEGWRYLLLTLCKSPDWQQP
jgi:hypothetical protein